MKSLATVARIKMADDSLSSFQTADLNRLKIIHEQRAQAALSVSN